MIVQIKNTTTVWQRVFCVQEFALGMRRVAGFAGQTPVFEKTEAGSP